MCVVLAGPDRRRPPVLELGGDEVLDADLLDQVELGEQVMLMLLLV